MAHYRAYQDYMSLEGVLTQSQCAECGASCETLMWTSLQKSRFSQANRCENPARSLTFHSAKRVKLNIYGRGRHKRILTHPWSTRRASLLKYIPLEGGMHIVKSQLCTSKCPLTHSQRTHTRFMVEDLCTRLQIKLGFSNKQSHRNHTLPTQKSRFYETSGFLLNWIY